MLFTPTGFLLLRLAIAASMFTHGLVRLPKLAKFSVWMVGNFEKSMIPKMLVLPFSYALPVIEFIIGLLLLLGLFTKQSLFAGGIVMFLLLLGTGMIENWEAVPSQLMHAAIFAILISNIHQNSYALDHMLNP